MLFASRPLPLLPSGAGWMENGDYLGIVQLRPGKKGVDLSSFSDKT